MAGIEKLNHVDKRKFISLTEDALLSEIQALGQVEVDYAKVDSAFDLIYEGLTERGRARYEELLGNAETLDAGGKCEVIMIWLKGATELPPEERYAFLQSMSLGFEGYE